MLLVGAAVWLTASVAGADEGLSGSVRAGLEYDDNPYRLQDDDPRLTSDDEQYAFLDDRGDALTRYFVRLESSHQLDGGDRFELKLRHGGKLFRRSRQADALITQVETSYRRGLGADVSLLFDADLKDRLERRSRFDYARGRGQVGVGWAPDGWSVALRGGLRYFAYKPDPRLGSKGPQVSAFGRRYLGEQAAIEGAYAHIWRDFSGERSDVFHQGRLGFLWRGDVYADLMYVLALNRSNRDAHDLTRHGVRITFTAPLFEELYGSARVELQRTDAADRSDAIFLVDEENRNNLVVSVARPIGDALEVEARYGLYLEEFSGEGGGAGRTDVDYARQTVSMMVGWEFE